MGQNFKIYVINFKIQVVEKNFALRKCAQGFQRITCEISQNYEEWLQRYHQKTEQNFDDFFAPKSARNFIITQPKLIGTS